MSDNDSETPRAVTNAGVGQRIGLTESAVSRIRSGGRYPSIRAVKRIAAEFGWSVADQLALIPTERGEYDGKYAAELERRLNDPKLGA